jgi:hypothetical protein
VVQLGAPAWVIMAVSDALPPLSGGVHNCALQSLPTALLPSAAGAMPDAGTCPIPYPDRFHVAKYFVSKLPGVFCRVWSSSAAARPLHSHQRRSPLVTRWPAPSARLIQSS